jgi:hypothetical protein
MTPSRKAPVKEADYTLDIFCAKGKGDAYRIHVWPGWLPGFLRSCFDENWEAYPVYIDLEELDRQMEMSGVKYEKKVSTVDAVQLKATGPGAMVLAVWLSQSFASGNFAMPGTAADTSGHTGSGMTG